MGRVNNHIGTGAAGQNIPPHDTVVTGVEFDGAVDGLKDAGSIE